MILGGCLLVMDESEAFSVGKALLLPGTELLCDRSETWLMLCTFDELVKMKLPRDREELLAKRGDLGDDITSNAMAGIVTAWICEHLPLPSVLLFLDNFLIKGRKIFYRYGLALLHRWATHPGRETVDVDDIATAASDAQELASEAFSYNFSSKAIARSALVAHQAAWSLLTSKGQYLGVGERPQSVAGATGDLLPTDDMQEDAADNVGELAATEEDVRRLSRRMSIMSLEMIDLDMFQGGKESASNWHRSTSQARRVMRSRVRSILSQEYPLLHKQKGDELEFGDLELARERLHLEGELGRGAFGTVHKAVLHPREGLHRQQGESMVVAVKS